MKWLDLICADLGPAYILQKLQNYSVCLLTTGSMAVAVMWPSGLHNWNEQDSYPTKDWHTRYVFQRNTLFFQEERIEKKIAASWSSLNPLFIQLGTINDISWFVQTLYCYAHIWYINCCMVLNIREKKNEVTFSTPYTMLHMTLSIP